MDGRQLEIDSPNLRVLVLKGFEVPAWKESGRAKAKRGMQLEEGGYVTQTMAA